MDALTLATCFHYVWFQHLHGGQGRSAYTPNPLFSRFVSRLIDTTQAIEEVKQYALLLIHRLKNKCNIDGVPGSEYRIATLALILANKCIDDSVFTSRTWSEVSGFDLAVLSAGERDFLLSIEHKLPQSVKAYTAHLTWTAELLRAREITLTGCVRRPLSTEVVRTPRSAPVSPTQLSSSSRKRRMREDDDEEEGGDGPPRRSRRLHPSSQCASSPPRPVSAPSFTSYPFPSSLMPTPLYIAPSIISPFVSQYSTPTSERSFAAFQELCNPGQPFPVPVIPPTTVTLHQIAADRRPGVPHNLPSYPAGYSYPAWA